MTPCTQCGQPNDSGDSFVCSRCLAARNFPPAPANELREKDSLTMSNDKPQTVHAWGDTLWAMASAQRTSVEFAQAAQEIFEQGFGKREDLLSICYTSPQAVNMYTRDLQAAIRTLVEFAWTAVQSQTLPTQISADAPTAISALEATLMWFNESNWDDAKRQKWERLTGNKEATTRVLCDCVRAAIAAEAVQS